MRKGSTSSLIINIISIFFLGSLCIIYSYRLIHYYRLEHKVYNNETKLYEVLLNNKGIKGTDEGLQYIDNEYIYGSNSENNYLYFAGRMWRILSIDSDNNIKIITNESQTILSWNNVEFNESDINKYLNKSEQINSGIFELSLKNQTDKVVKQPISLLTIDEYKKLNSKNYLVNNPFWIIGEDNKPAYVNKQGEIVTEVNNETLGIRPTLLLSNEVLFIKGNGKEDSPYEIMNHGGEKIIDTYVGEYISYSDNLWRIINVDDSGITIALNKTLDEELLFSNNNIFNIDNGIGNYLNTTFYDSLKNKEYIVKSDYYIGGFNNSYLNVFERVINVNVATYKISDFFIDDCSNYFTTNYYPHDNKTVYIINNNNKLFIDYITSKHLVRPVLKLDKDLFIVSGKGMIDNPYEVGR